MAGAAEGKAVAGSEMSPGRLVIRCGDWSTLREPAARIRMAVFIDEQRVPAELEWDADDLHSVHCVVEIDGVPVATGRLLPDGQIGRMAVLAGWRGRSLGGRVLERLVAVARGRGDTVLRLSAQCHAEGFYCRHGFDPAGPVYEEVGIPHRAMQRVLSG